MTPLAILVERADAALLAHGAAAQEELLRQIEAAIRNGEDHGKIRDLDHVLQLVEYRERPPLTGADSAARPRGSSVFLPTGPATEMSDI